METRVRPQEQARSMKLSHLDDSVEIVTPEKKIPMNDFKDF
jgi:hypothetical protein